jgi:hypothetical protein
LPTIPALKAALEKAGPDFIEDDGVRLSREERTRRLLAAGAKIVKGTGKGVIIRIPRAAAS